MAGGRGRGDVPRQLHLAMGKTYAEMTVSWSTSSASASVVQYGLSKDSLDLSATGNSSTYSTRSVPKEAHAFVDYTSPMLHHVVLRDLKPSSTYFYRAGTAPVGSFRTPPAPGDALPLKMFLVGDLGQTLDSKSTMTHMLEEQADVLLHAGDMSYADCDSKRWDSYFDMIEPLSKAIPWMVAAGNHEIEPDGTGGIMSSFKHRYAMPEVKPGVDTSRVFQNPSQTGFDCTPSAFTGSYDFGNSFYSFDLGLVHVVVLNAYVHTDPDSAQFKWLEQDLLSVDRSTTPWVISMFHSPWYNSNEAHQGEFNTIAMRESMEPLFHQHNVSMAFCGHVHAYERSRPVYMNKTDVRGTTYFNVGDGGNREGHSSKWNEAPEWNAMRNGDMFGHSRLTFQNRTHALFEWVPNDGSSWVTGDSVWVRNLNA